MKFLELLKLLLGLLVASWMLYVMLGYLFWVVGDIVRVFRRNRRPEGLFWRMKQDFRDILMWGPDFVRFVRSGRLKRGASALYVGTRRRVRYLKRFYR